MIFQPSACKCRREYPGLAKATTTDDKGAFAIGCAEKGNDQSCPKLLYLIRVGISVADARAPAG
jgi:hypothetical protein